MNTVEQLRAAKALIDTPEKYFVGYHDAELEDGKRVTHRNKRAVKYSLCGAWRMSKSPWVILTAFCNVVGDDRKCMADFGKLHHVELMALFDRAIADAGQAEVQS